ncbi:MAG TPA: Hpt domain-containing protein [Opitutales bacterium]|nr:Hpt domain-containing protein [Opitutales bacterium]
MDKIMNSPVVDLSILSIYLGSTDENGEWLFPELLKQFRESSLSLLGRVGNESAANDYDAAASTLFLFAGVARLVGAVRLEKMALALRHRCMEGAKPSDANWALFVDAIVDFIETAGKYHKELISSL